MGLIGTLIFTIAWRRSPPRGKVYAGSWVETVLIPGGPPAVRNRPDSPLEAIDSLPQAPAEERHPWW
jgi:hypothetical protein